MLIFLHMQHQCTSSYNLCQPTITLQSLSATFFEVYAVSYNIYFVEEEVLHVLGQMPHAQLCVHVCDHVSHKEVPLMCVLANLLALQVTQQPA